MDHIRLLKFVKEKRRKHYSYCFADFSFMYIIGLMKCSTVPY